MTRFYVYAGKFDIRTGKAPKLREFTSAVKARAYAIQVMNRVGENGWDVYNNKKFMKTAFHITKKKDGYWVWDLYNKEGIYHDLKVRTDGTLLDPKIVDGRPDWGHAKIVKDSKKSRTLLYETVAYANRKKRV